MIFTYNILWLHVLSIVFGLVYKHLVQSTVLYPDSYSALKEFLATMESRQIMAVSMASPCCGQDKPLPAQRNSSRLSTAQQRCHKGLRVAVGVGG